MTARAATIGQLWQPITDWLAGLPASECWLTSALQAAECRRELARGLYPDAAYRYARNAATWARLARERVS